ncbi:MAG: shikimate kinase [Clostridia bacterium]|nr:shikimate kinase [Clostridia bacterium]
MANGGRFGLLGGKLGHSLSPEIHALLAEYEYRLYPTEPEGLDAFFADASLDGFNVTIPYKVEAFRRCTVRSPSAERIGSVNTVVRRADGTLYGDNTDYFGFLQMAARIHCSFQGKKVVIFGTGGASRTVQAAAADGGARAVVCISRTGAETYQTLDRHADAEIIVNTTPVGMYPDTGKAPADLTLFPRCEAVLDLIYNPARTALLQQAAALGIDHVGGLYMLVAQALRSAEQFLGASIPLTEIDRIHDRILRAQKNIVLIGMPGCGKSTAARLLGERTGRPVVDLDACIEAQGTSIPALIEQYGEAEFRRRESEVLRQYAKEKGQIIATGGGAILLPENRLALRENSEVVFLDAPLAQLATDGRPLSAGGPARLQALAQTRMPLYLETADVTVEVAQDPLLTVTRIEQALKL